MVVAIPLLLAMSMATAPQEGQAVRKKWAVPSAPVLADTNVVRDAIADAYACVTETGTTELQQRVAAQQRVSGLSDNPTAAQLQEARSAVVTYVRARQAKMRCIASLSKAKAFAKTKGDTDAILRAARDLKSFWIGQSKYELQILTRFVNRALGEDEERLQY